MIGSKPKYYFKKYSLIYLSFGVLILTALIIFNSVSEQKNKIENGIGTKKSAVKDSSQMESIITPTDQNQPDFINSLKDISNQINIDKNSLKPPPEEIKNPEIPFEIDAAITPVQITKPEVSETVKTETEPKITFTRQLLEVLPVNRQSIKGRIKLSLLIGSEGNVKEHVVVSNSIECEDCLKNILDAAYRSRWQPLIVKGIKKEFWTEKLYEFN